MPSARELVQGFAMLAVLCGYVYLLAYHPPWGIGVFWATLVLLPAWIWISERQKAYFWMAATFAVVPTVFIVIATIHNSTD